MASTIFIIFRSLRCHIENNDNVCGTNILCATWISIYLIIFWGLKLIHGSVRQELRKDLSLSMEKITKMQISWTRAGEGILLTLMAGCGLFLFAL